MQRETYESEAATPSETMDHFSEDHRREAQFFGITGVLDPVVLLHVDDVGFFNSGIISQTSKIMESAPLPTSRDASCKGGLLGEALLSSGVFEWTRPKRGFLDN